MEVTIRNYQKKINLNVPQIIKITTRILKSEGLKRACLSVVFVTSQKISSLNKKYLHRCCSTDVLAFDLKDADNFSKDILIGDIIISTDAVIHNSRLFKTTYAYELVLYIAHGILHLLGFDDQKKKSIKQMRRKEKKVMTLVANYINASIR